jgi:hypoxanthine phosphoribosyltransferase
MVSEAVSKKIRIHDKEFELFIPEKEIKIAVEQLASELKEKLAGKSPLFLVVLNGSFLFASDLVRAYGSSCSVSFIRLKSYQGTSSSGKVEELIGLTQDCSGKVIVLVEDIVDTGNTLAALSKKLALLNPSELLVVSLFLKPSVYKGNIPVDHVGFKVADKFLVGYGLDYNEIGRNLKDVYALI